MKTIRLLTLALLAFSVAAGCRSGKNTKESSSSHKLLLVSFDGFRYDYLSKTDTPNFDAIARSGVRGNGLIPVFPSKTFPNHYAIATGLYPEDNKLVANTMYDPKFDATYKISDRDAVTDGRWYGGEPIWNTAEKQGMTTGTMFWVGSEADIENMHPTYYKDYDKSMPYHARIDTVVEWMTQTDRPQADLATLYFSVTDTYGHYYGPGSDSIKVAIQKADETIGYLARRMKENGLWDTTDLIIVSDHGMVQLDADKVIELDKLINMDDVDVITWSPVAMIRPKEGKTNEVYEALKKHENHYKVYRKENLPERYHLKGSRRVPEIVMVADMPWTILDSDRLQAFRDRLPSGTHGYDNREAKMHAFFLAHGPDFKEGFKMHTFQNVHLYDLMAHLEGLKPAPNDGSLDSVKVMLR